ncbi:hypothetical protein QBC47DRAFT_374509 [Echria macrotheca]|uniref:DNA polymerase n=1 Tax=Echria macrotheca TaxID=438768 RepID=A0AAJ0F7V4_9PEZI|nr:hypothetical protein QBC47DRAFT_374509 [Echria macrotheca]
MDVFKVRLNCIDHYQAKPSRYDPPLRNDVRASQLTREPRVPVIRVFGSTETGQKVCAHIHGAFPYLFVQYRGPLDRSIIGEYIYRLHSSIDRALALSYRRNVQKEQPRFVARITLVKGVPFYGFHVGYRFYLKIYMLNPLVMTRLADLLQQGLIMNQKFQPYEAHLQYLLQFMVDYNLYGCDYIETDNAVFRAPIPKRAPVNDEDKETPLMWDDGLIAPDRITDDLDLPRSSHCSIEVDICVADILNRKAIRERRLHHDFIEKDNPLPSDIKLVHSMAGLWRDETKRRKRRAGNLNPGSSIFPPEVLVSMSADPRRTELPGWIHEDEYSEEIRRLVLEEENTMQEPISFSNYVNPDPLEAEVKTVLESVTDLFPENLLPALGLEDRFLAAHPEAVDSVEVDESGILDLEIDQEAKQLFSDETDETTAEDVPGKTLDPKLKDKESAFRDQVISAGRDDQDLGVENKATYHGPAETITRVPVRRTINGLGAGFGISGLRTGERPKFPLPPELLSEIKSNVLFSRRVNDPQVENKPTDKKRRGSALESPSFLKRGKHGSSSMEEASSSATSHLSVPENANNDDIKTEATGRSEAKQPSKSSQSPAPSRQMTNQTLKFPVVKDPQDVNTRFRLSQQSGSQPSQDSPAKKVTFDPLLSVKEVPHSKSTKTPGTPRTPKTPSSVLSTTPKSPQLLPPRLLWEGPTRMFLVNSLPPSTAEVCSTMQEHGLPDVIYQDAYYSKDEDVPARPREYAGREFRLDGNSLPYLPEFDATGQSPATFGVQAETAPDFTALELAFEKQRRACTLKSWEIAEPPPSFDEVGKWWTEREARKLRQQSQSSSSQSPATQKPYLSQILGATPKNKHGFRYSQKKKSTSVQHEAQYMSTMSLEVHVNTRGKLVPNPEEDEVQCIFWCLKSDEQSLLSSTQSSGQMLAGVVVLSEDGSLTEKIRRQTSAELDEEPSELDVMTRMVQIVRTYDPDILTGYEVHGSSWGYLIERARFKYDYDLCDEFSRMKSDSHGRAGKDADRWGFNTTSTIRVTGRHMINIWRAMRGELNLLQYTMENVVWHLLHRRIPHYSWQSLTTWYTSGKVAELSKVLRYYLARTRLDIEVLEANELVPRTSEQARLLGVDFFSVFSRGSQFKVESIMFRIAKPENFMLVSPSRKQVGGQNALECLPLVMEPQSAFYSSPLLVLDFQSLYPSVMIAYNYCYSTFLGRIVNWRGTNKMGFTEYKRREGLLSLLKDYINIAPNGIMYTKATIRKSLLAKMLTEILETRVMVKSGMKQDKDDKTLQQLLNNRQLALKLLANVTYGYASASFSGRMPCSEIADSIVQTGRETLERAIAYIHSVERWGAEVVYGDTDSLFVYLKGRTREQAFDIGAEMAEEITNMNPRPVKLKFEKVYHPCVLLAKKRYVGYKFESREQTVPEFDAKGIETVRRDGTPAEQKIEEKALKILFETADLSQVKAYFQAQCGKIIRGDVSVQDFCFAREVKLGTYSNKGPGPAGALISARRMAEDARAEPQYGERVPYVVVSGGPGARLIDRCVAPEDLLVRSAAHASLDAEYYIGKNIVPPLERIFGLVGANVRSWYDEMPRVQQVRNNTGGGGAGLATDGKAKTLEWFLHSASCMACGVKMKTARPAGINPWAMTTVSRGAGGEQQQQQQLLPVCRRCAEDPAATMVQLQAKVNVEARKYADVVKVCQSCAGMAPLEEVPCDSRDCPVYYSRVKQASRLKAQRGMVEPVLRELGSRGEGSAAVDW